MCLVPWPQPSPPCPAALSWPTSESPSLSCMFRVCSRGLALSVPLTARARARVCMCVCPCPTAPEASLCPQNRTGPPRGQSEEPLPSQRPPFLLRRGPPSCPASDPAQPCLSWDPAAHGGKCRQPAGYAPGRPVQPAFSLPPGPQGGSLCSPAPVLPSPGSPGYPAPLSTPLTQRPQGSRCLLCMRPGWLSGSPSPAPCGIGGVLAAAPDMGRTRPLGWTSGLVLVPPAHPAGSHPPCCSDAGG